MLSEELVLGQEVLVELPQNFSPPPPPAQPVGQYGACEMAADASDSSMQRWKQRFKLQHLPTTNKKCGPSFCTLYENLYFYDRCWNPRFACAITIGTGGSSSTLVVAQRDAEKPAGKTLRAGGYLTVLGPAAAFGVGAINGFADILRGTLGMPVVNLGRGGAGPSLYLGAEDEHVTELLAQSRVVIILVMAGRSSANSAFPRATSPARTRFFESTHR